MQSVSDNNFSHMSKPKIEYVDEQTPKRSDRAIPQLDTGSTRGSHASMISLTGCNDFKFDSNCRKSMRIPKNDQIEEVDQNTGTVNIFKRRKTKKMTNQRLSVKSNATNPN